MADTTDTEMERANRIEEITAGGCEIDGCDRDVRIISRGMGTCQGDHSDAAVLGWDPEELVGFHVECKGHETIFRAPTREQAEKQWWTRVRASHFAEVDPNRNQPTPEDAPYGTGPQGES